MTDPELIALFEIASTRVHLTSLEVGLMTIAGDLDPADEQSIVGMPDIHYATLRALESRLALMDAARVASVAGPAAGEAVTGYQASFDGLRECYGLACGPDRTAETAAALTATLRAVAATAHGHLVRYMAEIRGLPEPTLDTYSQALQRRMVTTLGRVAEPRRTTVPQIRRRLSGDETATRARTALGYGFGGLASAYLKMRAKPERLTGMIVLGDLAGVTSWVGAKASMLQGRCAHDDSVFAAHAEGISDDLDALYRVLEKAIAEQNAGPEALGALSAPVSERVRRLSSAIREVERLAAERGYIIAPPAFRAAPEPSYGLVP